MFLANGLVPVAIGRSGSGVGCCGCCCWNCGSGGGENCCWAVGGDMDFANGLVD